MSEIADGQVIVNGSLAPVLGETFRTAIELARKLVRGENPAEVPVDHETLEDHETPEDHQAVEMPGRESEVVDAAEPVGHGYPLRLPRTEARQDFAQGSEMPTCWEVSDFIEFGQWHVAYPTEQAILDLDSGEMSEKRGSG